MAEVGSPSQAQRHQPPNPGNCEPNPADPRRSQIDPAQHNQHAPDRPNRCARLPKPRRRKLRQIAPRVGKHERFAAFRTPARRDRRQIVSAGRASQARVRLRGIGGHVLGMIRTSRDSNPRQSTANASMRMPILVVPRVRYPASLSTPRDQKRIKAPTQNFEAFIRF
jgi:hypothetical protein